MAASTGGRSSGRAYDPCSSTWTGAAPADLDIRVRKGDNRTAETTAGHAGAVDTWRRDEAFHQRVDAGCRHLEVVAQADVARGHELAGAGHVSGAQCIDEVEDAPVLADHVTGSPHENWIVDGSEVVGRGVS